MIFDSFFNVVSPLLFLSLFFFLNLPRFRENCARMIAIKEIKGLLLKAESRASRVTGGFRCAGAK